ncbi:MAG: Cd(II)/Pb(II)-responsive transcriptional regulator [Pseudomonadota bacterium]|nr:Cd(II)/Pb(II)-responsive transcriptional regulator [Pseudomonadota bacterium]
MPKSYRIGDLATRLAVSVETIRYYEREGLLPKADRSEGNYRLYTDQHSERLEFILHCRALDMTHEEIRSLLRLRDSPELGCAEVNAFLDEHIEHVAWRLRALRNLQSELKSIRARCEAPSTARNCGILQELALPSKKRRPSTKVGVHAQKMGR